ncbi:hypothetical protein FJY63_06480 [Candidatus Sumerlaeota bacterium]|nr:hypothetical protein [Candidatus Sumerlaeota bacterium]
MTKHYQQCTCGCNRREFVTGLLTAGAALGLRGMSASHAGTAAQEERKKQGAVVRAAFLYPPSKQFADNPDGWWSWPGNHFDAEGQQKRYMAAFQEMEKKLGMKIVADNEAIGTADGVQRFISEIRSKRPDGVLLVMFYNGSLSHADAILKATAEAKIPTVLFIGLAVHHGRVGQYRRPGVYFIQSLDNLAAIEYGMRMIAAKKAMTQTRLLSITEAKEPREAVEPFFSITVRVVPFPRYAEEFKKVTIDAEARRFIKQFTGGARENRGVTTEAFENTARAHFALKKLLAQENANGLAMNCLRRGMLKPCISFATLNSELVPAACENDLPALYTQLLGQLLTGRPGFQHNPCYETEGNHYFASHCTCPTRLQGPDGQQQPYLLRKFAHSNEGSCAIQVFWTPGDPATMVKYYPGKEPTLDVYAAKVVRSHPIPPAAGCTTNVEIEIADRDDACMVQGHHNVLFCGDFARKFRLFAQLYGLKLLDSGYKGPWPI